MKIHEFQAKQLFRDADIAVPDSIVARSPEAAAAAFEKLGGSIAVVKAQIHAGGRGKGTIKSNPEQRGVQLVKSADEAAAVAENLLGEELVTVQTGPAGKTVQQVLVEAGCDIARELYLGIVIDRACGMPVLMVSSEGGVNIEEVAAKTPELILKESFHPDEGLQTAQVKSLCAQLDITGDSVKSADKFMKALCKLFVDLDCSIAEINPLVVTGGGEIIALDAKINFDDNALFRHKEFEELRDLSEEDPAEVRAGEAGLSYVQLDGNIGCLVNGAGLAMSTMDIIKPHAGEPANFLDVGGGAKVEQVTEAFR
ncbi:MAG: ADP-forming succinate--CoA ligase subunit beta, partial [Proteobacteria bacterium]|nr:ADP-forming succinate--CoA ligase subunit beta [Pseudomonadota bacterium]